MRVHRNRVLRLSLALGLSLTVTACDDAASTGNGGAADATPPAACADGALRCVGENVELCVRGVFVDQGACAVD